MPCCSVSASTLRTRSLMPSPAPVRWSLNWALSDAKKSPQKLVVIRDRHVGPDIALQNVAVDPGCFYSHGAAPRCVGRDYIVFLQCSFFRTDPDAGVEQVRNRRNLSSPLLP